MTDEIQDWIERVSKLPVDGSPDQPDVCIIELGGTVGDIESMPFIEALRQFQFRVGSDNFCLIHVSLVPVVGAVGEQKTKPTQHSVQALRSAGLSPHMLACRSQAPLEQSVLDKLALFCHVTPDCILNLCDVSNIWHVPLVMQEQGGHLAIMRQLKLDFRKLDLDSWAHRANKWDAVSEPVNIAIVGKYTGLGDSYLSVTKALMHSAISADRKLNIVWIEAGMLEDTTLAEDPSSHADAWAKVHSVDGILVPGGFGERGTEGKILTAKYARENKVPFLGICLGMQLLFSRSAEGDTPLLGLFDAACTAFTPTSLRSVPHMGWNQLVFRQDHPLLDGVNNGAHVYFVHSYFAPVTPQSIAVCSYGHYFTAIVGKENFMGCQFHPERSGSVGARILQNFLEMP